MKQTLAILLSLLLVFAAMPIAMSAIASEEDTATLTIDGTEYTAHVGDTIHYEYLINMSDIGTIPGRITEFEGYFNYSSDMLNILTAITEYDEEDDDFIYPAFPSTKRGLVVGTEDEGVIKYNGTKNAESTSPKAGWDFSTERALIRLDIQVTKGGTGSVTNDLRNVGSNVTRIVYESEVVDEFKEKFIPKTVVTIDCDHETPATEAPATDAPATEAPATEAPATDAPATEAPATDAPEPTMAYYVVGSFTDWSIDPAYRLSVMVGADAEEYFETFALTAGDKFKVVGSFDGSAVAENGWFPSGTDNDIEITVSGENTIYFRPNYDGNDDWVGGGCIYVAAPAIEPETDAPVTDAPVTEAPATDAPATDAPATEANTEKPEFILTDKATGVSVVSGYEIDAELIVTKVNHFTLDVVFPDAYNNDIYRVKLVKGDKEVVPNGFLTLVFPAKDAKSKLYQADSDWNPTAADAVFDAKEKTLSYVTDSLGNFVVSSAADFAAYIRGNADMKDDLTILDATAIQRWLAELEDFSELQLLIADFDCSGDVTILDATAIQRWLAELSYIRYNQD